MEALFESLGKVDISLTSDTALEIAKLWYRLNLIKIGGCYFALVLVLGICIMIYLLCEKYL